ncbi:Ornithine carbamoyltransferase [Caldithrix abyssi DSM 13497]|uniref:Ornithine carbamoyltransferase n=1 Tax=Caldithrix abyssi DSM 13497 TaxID=880073 RepID=H1XYL0_CALAY|nr:ornithine carbamoyltransferase [Caldithrix abyssi]APF19718.1 ornithine carbamoyltransferase [Caldithrix abyssi DSM 13497]EHO39828.1 Ornithine carbamoyltransferase [Caldithrix abyssi DSM 13497]
MKKDFISIADYSREELEEIFELTKELKAKTKRGEEHHLCKGKTMAMIFAKPSARTRISFETGMYQLGGYALYLSPNDIGIGKREAVKDIARVVSRYNDIIMARLFDHAHILEMAEYASVPVINGLTDYNHPCQIMADIFTVLEKRGHLKDLKITYIGDGNNVANSWVNLASKLPMHLVICSPSGFEPDDETLTRAREAGVSQIEIVHDPQAAVKDADVVYTDVWASMGQEAEAEKRRKVFMPYQVNAELMSHARKDALVMHCLPAHRGEEITDDVIDGPQSIVFDEAENRMHVQKAIIAKLLCNA